MDKRLNMPFRPPSTALFFPPVYRLLSSIPPCLTPRKHEPLKPSSSKTTTDLLPTLRHGNLRSPTQVLCTSRPSLHFVHRLCRLSGLFSFASTTFILSLYNVNARNIHTPNVVVGMACFSGGLAQFVAGMWEFPRGNVFGATGAFAFIAPVISSATAPDMWSSIMNSHFVASVI